MEFTWRPVIRVFEVTKLWLTGIWAVTVLIWPSVKTSISYVWPTFLWARLHRLGAFTVWSTLGRTLFFVCFLKTWHVRVKENCYMAQDPVLGTTRTVSLPDRSVQSNATSTYLGSIQPRSQCVLEDQPYTHPHASTCDSNAQSSRSESYALPIEPSSHRAPESDRIWRMSICSERTPCDKIIQTSDINQWLSLRRLTGLLRLSDAACHIVRHNFSWPNRAVLAGTV